MEERQGGRKATERPCTRAVVSGLYTSSFFPPSPQEKKKIGCEIK